VSQHLALSQLGLVLRHRLASARVLIDEHAGLADGGQQEVQRQELHRVHLGEGTTTRRAVSVN